MNTQENVISSSTSPFVFFNNTAEEINNLQIIQDNSISTTKPSNLRTLHYQTNSHINQIRLQQKSLFNNEEKINAASTLNKRNSN